MLPATYASRRKMKKYYQLLLLLSSVTSLGLFLLYRHEYNRLHYVLEVFNFFGHPCNISELRASENIVDHHDWGPTPLWRQSENVQVYSAFWNNKNEIQAIVLRSGGRTVTKTCYVWFEDAHKPQLGSIRFSKIFNDSSTKQSLYWYFCSLKNNSAVPYAVSFSLGKKKPSQLNRIPVTHSLHKNFVFNITVCVTPSMFNKMRFVEFLAFHQLVGINSYIFYGGDVPHHFAKLLTNFLSRINVSLTYFPWNFPYLASSVLNREVVTQDCLMRNKDQSRFVIVLENDEFIVPSNSQSVLNIFNNSQTNFHRYALPVQRFCVRNTNTYQPLSLQNFEVVSDMINPSLYLYSTNTAGFSTSVHSFNNFASVHKYIYCLKEPQRTYRDTSILKFSSDLIKSTLFDMFKHNYL